MPCKNVFHLLKLKAPNWRSSSFPLLLSLVGLVDAQCCPESEGVCLDGRWQVLSMAWVESFLHRTENLLRV